MTREEMTRLLGKSLLIKPKVASEILGMSVPTIHKMVYEDKLKGVVTTVGERRRIMVNSKHVQELAGLDDSKEIPPLD